MIRKILNNFADRFFFEYLDVAERIVENRQLLETKLSELASLEDLCRLYDREIEAAGRRLADKGYYLNRIREAT